jgi:hypothetical protein
MVKNAAAGPPMGRARGRTDKVIEQRVLDQRGPLLVAGLVCSTTDSNLC